MPPAAAGDSWGRAGGCACKSIVCGSIFLDRAGARLLHLAGGFHALLPCGACWAYHSQRHKWWR